MAIKEAEFNWTPMTQIKVGDFISHWGSADEVLAITVDENEATITVHDELLNTQKMWTYKPTAELMILTPAYLKAHQARKAK